VANHSVAKNLKKNQLLILTTAVLLVVVVLHVQLVRPALLVVLLHLALVLQEEQHTVAAVAAK
jgi:hypothetical protein